MIDTIFLLMAMTPLFVGLGFFLKPRKMKKIQSWYRKKMEGMEKFLHRYHRAAGISFMLMGFGMLYTYVQPVWVYNVFTVARVVMGLFFPQVMDQVQTVDATPMVCI